MVITAVMVHKQRAIVRRFEQTAATTAATARTAEQLGLTPGMAWHQLVGHAVLRCPGEARFWMRRTGKACVGAGVAWRWRQ